MYTAFDGARIFIIFSSQDKFKINYVANTLEYLVLKNTDYLVLSLKECRRDEFKHKNKCASALSFEIGFYWSLDIYQWSPIHFKKTCQWHWLFCIFASFRKMSYKFSFFRWSKCIVNKHFIRPSLTYNRTYECTSKTNISL